MTAKAAQIGLSALWMAVVCAPAGATPAEAPSRPAVDMPELAAVGPWPVGTVEELVDTGTVAQFTLRGPSAGTARKLHVQIWYPAAAAGTPKPYVHLINLIRGPSVSVTTPSMAAPSAPPARGRRFPLVVVSHGLGGWDTSMTYLTENLASKGYVVAAIDHEEPIYRSVPEFIVAFENVVLDRAQDQRAVIRYLLDQAERGHGGYSTLIDPARLALVGYSMGGFGALAAAGANYDAQSSTLKKLPSALVADIEREDPRISKAIRALVLIAPWGAQPSERAWTTDGVGRISAPTLLIDGDKDDVVDYANGVRWVFDHLTGADRYMLVFEGAGHGVGSNPPPPEAHDVRGLSDYFTDPVWRTDRINGIELHFISAFLANKLKDETAASDYLNVPTPIAANGSWPQKLGDANQPIFAGRDQPNYWKGFQFRSAVGLELYQASRVETKHP